LVGSWPTAANPLRLDPAAEATGVPPKVAGQNTCLHIVSGQQSRYATSKPDSNVQNLESKDRYADLEASLNISGPFGAASPGG
jgi:hypothetical protein